MKATNPFGPNASGILHSPGRRPARAGWKEPPTLPRRWGPWWDRGMRSVVFLSILTRRTGRRLPRNSLPEFSPLLAAGPSVRKPAPAFCRNEAAATRSPRQDEGVCLQGKRDEGRVAGRSVLPPVRDGSVAGATWVIQPPFFFLLRPPGRLPARPPGRDPPGSSGPHPSGSPGGGGCAPPGCSGPLAWRRERWRRPGRCLRTGGRSPPT